MSFERQLFAPLSPHRRYRETLHYPHLPHTHAQQGGNHRDIDVVHHHTSWSGEQLLPRQPNFNNDVVAAHERAITTRKGRWSPQEDSRLIGGIHKFGANRWKEVAEEVGTRTGDQCWKRWNDSLDPRLKHTQWTSAEDALLEEAVLRCGRMWSRIATDTLPGRSGLACKNRWDHIQRKQRRIHQSERQILQQEQGEQDDSLVAYDLPQISSSPYYTFTNPRSTTTHHGQFLTLNGLPYPQLSTSYDSRSTVYDDEEQEDGRRADSSDSSEDQKSRDEYESRAKDRDRDTEELEEEEDRESEQDEEDTMYAFHVDNHSISHKEALYGHNRGFSRQNALALASSDQLQSNDKSSYRNSIFHDAKPLPPRESPFSTLTSTCNLPALKRNQQAHPQSLLEPRNYPATWYPTTSQYSLLTMPDRQFSDYAYQQKQSSGLLSSSGGPSAKRIDYFADAEGASKKDPRYSLFQSQTRTLQPSLHVANSTDLRAKSNEACITVKQEESDEQPQLLSSIYETELHSDKEAGPRNDWQGFPSFDREHASHQTHWPASIQEDNFEERYELALSEPFYPQILATSRTKD